jgi:hypothetical protein
MEKKFKVIHPNRREEEMTEFEIREKFTYLTSEFKMLLFRMKYTEELYHNDSGITFKRV